MLIRALIVLLIVLNLGVAAWWISRPEPLPPALPAQPAGVPRLQLLSESGKAAAVVPQPPAPTASAAPIVAAPAVAPVAKPAAPAQCFSVGPFADQAAAKSAAARLGSQASRSNPREIPGKAAQGYNVVLPPQADREAAQALAQRIGAAGFDDYLVVNSGAQTNGIALGRYRSREGAERRQSALRAAGFDAQLQPIGNEGAAQWWLDVAAAAGVTASGLQSGTDALQSRSLDCALLR
ncbi:SPOR domain-containing protein [Pseudoxanthomonas sacheonensis]|uniref:Cell division protein FtsN n=1 Tax=Pseudoxanthomonas sacheonensis TaxID=443615 RepID=A0ABU1RWX0_9GAMM|nr:SPOR domain-containing protein [Pseudoxanthomonas sacheonensis]MDR6843273.1 cell division protein FtsN [Pseudoxanthomonas sacheonensis]